VLSDRTLNVTTILRGLPYFDARTVVVVRNREVPIKPQQIVIWVSLADIEQSELVSGTPRFPAILDTGCSHNFGIREEHLIQWAGLRPEYFRKIGDTRVNNVAVSLHHADVWLHRNEPGRRDEMRDDRPFCLELDQGIMVYPTGTPNAPRLPLLGLRGLKWARLQLAIDCEHRRVRLRTPRRYWFF
jgi:hypothetical protein